MSKFYILENWQALELFCRVALKHDKKYSLGFSKKIDFDELIERYSDKKKALEVSRQIFGESEGGDWKADSEDQPPTCKYYNLSLIARSNEPVTFSTKTIKAYKDFINDSQYQIFPEWEVIDKKKISHLTKELYGKHSVYHYAEREEEEKEGEPKKQKIKGILRGTLLLNPCNIAELRIKDVKSKKAKPDIYRGEWSLDDQVNCLNIRMRIFPGGKKDLQMIFFLGADKPEITLGMFHNLDTDYIHSGKIIMINNQMEHISGFTDFYPFNGGKSKASQAQVPDYIKKFCQSKHHNVLKVVRRSAFTVDEFKDWVEEIIP